MAATDIQTKDRSDAAIDIAAKEIGAVKFPRNILVKPDGTDIEPASEATLAALNIIASAVQTAVESMNTKTTAVNTGAVTVSSSVLPTGAATQATLANIDTDIGAQADAAATTDTGAFSLTALIKRALQNWTTLLARVPALVSTTPIDSSAGMPVRQIPADLWRCSFSDTGSGVLSSDVTAVQTGAGQTVSQANGNLIISTGTTTNSETLIRSTRTFRGGLQLRFKTILSQRIVNQNFSVELADLVGSALAFTINSATSVTVTFPTVNPFTSANVGQSMNLGAVTGAAGIPGRYAIASVSGLTVTFTVAAWPASGSGTLTLWGWNYYRTLYSGTTATNAFWDAQRKGWASGDTTATINTTASPGHVVQMHTMGTMAALSDSLVASNAAYQFVPRASRIENLPNDDQELYLWISCRNGSTAPASTTTWTVGFISAEMMGRNKVYLAGADQASAPFATPVQVVGGVLATQPVSGTVTATVTGATQLPVTPSTTFTNSAATTNATNTKASAGTVWSVVATNTNAAVRFLKLYNKASAPTVGTDVPVLTLAISANGVPLQIGGGSNGLRFATGISWAVTTGAADGDTAAVAANEIKVGISFT